MSLIILENIRSAYNVGNVIRTADALWFDVIISGYTPSPDKEIKVKKTSLGSENSVNIKTFWDTKQAINHVKEKWWIIIAAEITDKSIDLQQFAKEVKFDNNIAILFWNEVDWVLQDSLELVDYVVHIPMAGRKESLNVWQASAIFMREIFRKLKRPH